MDYNDACREKASKMDGVSNDTIGWESVLNWTVFKAATSQPKACMINVAMVFPTYLEAIIRQRAPQARSFFPLRLTRKQPWMEHVSRYYPRMG